MNKHWTAEEQKEHRRLWVEALRSGRYLQTKSALRDGDRFCCLGVACDISGVSTWRGKMYAGAEMLLPRPVKDWLGLADDDGGFYNDTRSDLATRNDHGTSFSAIADIIESEPAGLLALSTAEEQKP